MSISTLPSASTRVEANSLTEPSIGTTCWGTRVDASTPPVVGLTSSILVSYKAERSSSLGLIVPRALSGDFQPLSAMVVPIITQPLAASFNQALAGLGAVVHPSPSVRPSQG